MLNSKLKKLYNKNISIFAIAVLSAGIIFLYGCSGNKVINEDKFVKIYSDLIIAQDTAGGNYKSNNELKKEVMKRYNVTQEQYKETVTYYNKEPHRWESFFTKVTAYINELKKKNSI